MTDAAPPNPALESFLRSIPLFSLIETSDMIDVLRLLRPMELTPGQVLFRQGEAGTAMWVLGSSTEVSISAASAQQQRPGVIAYARAGETVGEMALIDDGPRSGTAVVMQGGHAHQIDAVDFHAMRQTYSPPVFKILRRLCVELCGKLRATSDRIVAPSGRTVPTAHTRVRKATDDDVNAFGPLARLPKVVKLALAQKVTVVTLDGVEPLFSEGEDGDSAYFIINGDISVGRNGKTLTTVHKGGMLGLVSVIDRGRRSASCISAGPATLLRLSREEFNSLFTSGNRFAFDLVELVSRQLVAHVRDANDLVPRPGQIQARLTPPRPIPALREEDILPQVEILPLELDVDLEDFDVTP